MISKLGYNKKEEKGKINEILITYGFWVSRKKNKQNIAIVNVSFLFKMERNGVPRNSYEKKIPKFGFVRVCARMRAFVREREGEKL